MVSRRKLIVSVAAAAFVFGATSFQYEKGGTVLIDFERGYEGAFVEGFHPRERAEGKYFRWTDGASAVELQNLPTRGPIVVEARLRAIRPEGASLPSLAFTANGITVHRAAALPGVVNYHFQFPSTSSRLRLGIESDTFDAGGRTLGVQVLGIRWKLPDEYPSFEGPALWMALATSLLLTAALVSGLSFPVAVVSAVGLGAVLSHLLGFEAVRFSSYPRDVAGLAGATLGAAAILRAILDRVRWLHRTERAVAIGVLALVVLVKMGMLCYPLTLSSDADFQANRMRAFLQGNWHPTSVTQHDPPFEIPYPVALFAVATPLAKAGLDLVPALEIATGLFDVLVSGLLMFLGWRYLDDFRAGAMAGVLYQLVPMNALSFSAGNFTNVFAVAMLSFAFTFLAGGVAQGAGVSALLALTAHFGMLLEGLVLFPVWLALLWLGPKPVRDRRVRVSLAIAAAFVVAGAYYLGYLDLVAKQSGRALSGALSGGSLALLPEQMGLVFLATAALGCTSFLQRPLAMGWFGATLLFLALDLWMGIEIRYWLQALPLLALFSGTYLSRAFDRSVLGKVAAVGALGYISFVGLRTILEAMVFRYH
jgi:hypothetical protein